MNPQMHFFIFWAAALLLSAGFMRGQEPLAPVDRLADPIQAQSISVQALVDSAFYRSLRQRRSNHLRRLIDSMETQYHTTHQRIWAYWIAYTQYQLSIYAMVVDSTKRAAQFVRAAIRCLDTIDDKNSEEWALLSVMTGFSIAFRPWAGAWLGPRAVTYSEKAVALDSQNLRAWYALLVNDFYTPALFGGGTKVDYYAQQALRCLDQIVPNPYMPSWGRAETYEILIRWHIRAKRYDAARTLFEEALCRVGGHPILLRLKRQHSDLF